MNAIIFIVLLLFAIALHEFGHFITAKKFGIKVDKFFIGFGPKIWSIRRGETEYGFNWIPAGGYVRIAGMNPFEETPPEDQSRTFKAKRAWQRAIVLAAGSTMHFLLAFVVLAGLLMTAGSSKITTRVDLVDAKTPAATAGFQKGDRIVGVGGHPVRTWDDVRNYIRARPGATVAFDVRRAGSLVHLQAVLSHTPASCDSSKQVGFLGIAPAADTVKASVPGALSGSITGIGAGIRDSFAGLGRIVAPSTLAHLVKVVEGKQKRCADDPTSIVGITQIAGGAGLSDLLFIFVGFNIFVGVANLLPLPPLDGGHLAVLAYEKITRRDVDMRKLIPVTAAVVAVLVGLFVITLYLDIVQPLPRPG